MTSRPHSRADSKSVRQEFFSFADINLNAKDRHLRVRRSLAYDYSLHSTHTSDAYRVHLPTLADLVSFRSATRSRFAYAATAWEMENGNSYMSQYEWFFSDSIPSLIRAVFRSTYMGTFVVQNDDGDEGHWVTINTPMAMKAVELLTSFASDSIDPTLPIERATEAIQIEIFRNWHREGESELQFFDSKSLDDFILYWEDEKRDGQDYYGAENEHIFRAGT